MSQVPAAHMGAGRVWYNRAGGLASGRARPMVGHGDDGIMSADRGPQGLPDGLSPEEMRRWERLARRLLIGAVAVMGAMVTLIVVTLLLAPKDDSTLGMMKALVFRCH